MASQLQSTSGVNNTFASTVNATFGIALTPGSKIIVSFNADLTTTRANTPTDTAGNTYVRVTQTSVGVTIGEDAEVWYADNTSSTASNKVTVTDNGAGVDSGIIIEEWSGLTAGNADQSTAAQDSAPGTAMDSGATGTLAQANEVIITHAWNNLNSNSMSLTSPYTGLTQNHTTSPTGMGTSSQVVASTASVHGLMTTVSSDWLCIVTTWKIASTGIQDVVTSISPGKSWSNKFRRGVTHQSPIWFNPGIADIPTTMVMPPFAPGQAFEMRFHEARQSQTQTMITWYVQGPPDINQQMQNLGFNPGRTWVRRYGINKKQIFLPATTSITVNNFISSLSGVLSFTGNENTTSNKPLAGVLSFTGAIVKSTNHLFTATLSFVGSVVKSTIKSVMSGVLSFTGAFANSRLTILIFTATLSFTGSFVKTISKPLTAVLSFTGSFNKVTSHLFTAVLSFTGSFVKNITKSFTAVLSFVGAFTTRLIFIRAFTATLSFTGAFVKVPSKVFTATLTFTGSMARSISHLLTATLSFTGSFVKKIVKGAFVGVLSFTGAMSPSSVRFLSLTAVLSFTGAISRRTNKTISGVASFTGAMVKSTSKGMIAGLSFVGNITKRLARSITATLSFNGSLSNSIRKSVSGTLSFTGNLVTNFFHSGTLFFQSLTASLGFTGSISKRTSKIMIGSLSFVGLVISSVTQIITRTISIFLRSNDTEEVAQPNNVVLPLSSSYNNAIMRTNNNETPVVQEDNNTQLRNN